MYYYRLNSTRAGHTTSVFCLMNFAVAKALCSKDKVMGIYHFSCCGPLKTNQTSWKYLLLHCVLESAKQFLLYFKDVL